VDGTVSREFVLRILVEGGVSVAQQKDSDVGMIVLAKGDILDVRVIPDPVSRPMIHRFSREFGIAIHLFYA
jgi:hypothetical protein